MKRSLDKPEPWQSRTTGNLRGDIMHIAAQLIAERGPDALPLRDIAREPMSHAAPAHHYGDRRGPFTPCRWRGSRCAETLAELPPPPVSTAPPWPTSVCCQSSRSLRRDVPPRSHYSTEDSSPHAKMLRSTDADTPFPTTVRTVDIGDARRAAWALVQDCRHSGCPELSGTRT